MAGASGILRQQLVLLHGATASARVWDEVVPRLIVSHDVWIPTLAGHLGGPPLSVAPVDLVESIVDDVSRRLDEAGIESAHLVSNSLGGWLTLELARRGRARPVPAFALVERNSAVLLEPHGTHLSGGCSAESLARTSDGSWLAVQYVDFSCGGWDECADRVVTAQAIAALDDMAGCSVSRRTSLRVRVSRDRLRRSIDFRVRYASRGRPGIGSCGLMRYGASMLAAAPRSEQT